MSDLIDVADAAFPFDYSTLPAGVKVVLGYVGQLGATPHVWTRSEVAEVEATGRAWAPIHVVPNVALDAKAGGRAASLMVSELRAFGYATGGPVFLDVERSTYEMNVSGALAAVDAWTSGMAGAGWPMATAYVPGMHLRSWWPNWVTVKPAVLPDGVRGQQWSGPAGHPSCDLSVFDPAVFAALLNPTKETDVALDKTDMAWVSARLSEVQANTYYGISGEVMKGRNDPKHGWQLVNLQADIAALAKEVAALKVPAVDTAAIVAAIKADLGATIADQVATVLSERLKA